MPFTITPLQNADKNPLKVNCNSWIASFLPILYRNFGRTIDVLEIRNSMSVSFTDLFPPFLKSHRKWNKGKGLSGKEPVRNCKHESSLILLPFWSAMALGVLQGWKGINACISATKSLRSQMKEYRVKIRHYKMIWCFSYYNLTVEVNYIMAHMTPNHKGSRDNNRNSLNPSEIELPI